MAPRPLAADYFSAYEAPYEPPTAAESRLLLLPPELVDFIFRLLRPPADAPPSQDRKDGIDGLLALMRTCRALLPIGRAVLYEQPVIRFEVEERVVKQGPQHIPQAIKRLLETFKTMPDAARAVRNLPDMDRAIFIAALVTAERLHSTFSALLSDMLTLCTRLCKLQLVIPCLARAIDIGAVVARMTGLEDLQVDVTMTANSEGTTAWYRACLLSFLENRVNSAAPPLKTFAFVDDKHRIASNLAASEGFLDLAQTIAPHLRLHLYQYLSLHTVADLLRALTRTPDNLGLRELSVELEITADWLAPPELWRHISTYNMKAFSMVGATRPKFSRVAGFFLREASTCQVFPVDYPFELFLALPHVRDLQLANGTRMSLDKLSALATNSPDLERLDLNSTSWEVTVSALDATSPASDGVFSRFERELMAILEEQCTKLRFIDLGILPFEDCAQRGRPRLTEWAARRRIDLRVRGFGAVVA